MINKLEYHCIIINFMITSFLALIVFYYIIIIITN
jgi:hypothetical protein